MKFMALAQKNDEQYFDEVYDNISNLYGRAEKLLSLVENSEVADAEGFYSIMEPLVRQIEESANQVSTDFAAIVESGELPTNAMKRRVNSSLRLVLQKVEEYREMVESIEVDDE